AMAGKAGRYVSIASGPMATSVPRITARRPGETACIEWVPCMDPRIPCFGSASACADANECKNARRSDALPPFAAIGRHPIDDGAVTPQQQFIEAFAQFTRLCVAEQHRLAHGRQHIAADRGLHLPCPFVVDQ